MRASEPLPPTAPSSAAPAAEPRPPAAAGPPEPALDGAATETEAAPARSRFEFRLKSPVVPREHTRGMVLTYHNIDYTKQQSTTTPELFVSHLDRMQQTGVEVIPLSFLVEFLEGKRQLPETVAVITADDGAKSFYHRAYPILLERKVPFALAIIGIVLENPGPHGGMTPAQLRTMLDSGLCEIMSHGYRHVGLQYLPVPEIREELIHSREVIERLTGFRPITTAYPLGSISPDVRAQTEQTGYRAGLRAQGTGITHQTPLYAVSRYTMHRNTSAGALDRYPTLFFPRPRKTAATRP